MDNGLKGNDQDEEEEEHLIHALIENANASLKLEEIDEQLQQHKKNNANLQQQKLEDNEELTLTGKMHAHNAIAVLE